VRPPVLEFEGITVFTDELCFTDLVDKVKSKYKIAWILESPEVKPMGYNYIHLIEHKFDIVAICNADDYKKEKYKSYFGPGRWIPEKDACIHEKTKLISMVASDKTWLALHKFRHEIATKFRHKVDLWGSGYKKFKEEDSVLPYKDYMFSVVVENCIINGGFSEKIINCFATGTIPIYLGAKDIGKYFDIDGIITFSTIEELDDIINNLSFDLYMSKLQSIKNNYNIHHKYVSSEKYMYENIYSQLNDIKI
jgi:hypothetical protein